MFEITRRTALGSTLGVVSLASGAAFAASADPDDAEDRQYEQGNSNVRPAGVVFAMSLWDMGFIHPMRLLYSIAAVGVVGMDIG